MFPVDFVGTTLLDGLEVSCNDPLQRVVGRLAGLVGDIAANLFKFAAQPRFALRRGGIGRRRRLAGRRGRSTDFAMECCEEFFTERALLAWFLGAFFQCGFCIFARQYAGMQTGCKKRRTRILEAGMRRFPRERNEALVGWNGVAG